MFQHTYKTTDKTSKEFLQKEPNIILTEPTLSKSNQMTILNELRAEAQVWQRNNAMEFITKPITALGNENKVLEKSVFKSWVVVIQSVLVRRC